MIDSERTVLDYLISGYDPSVIDQIPDDAMSTQEHRQLWQICKRLYNTEKPIDLVTVASALKTTPTDICGVYFYPGVNIQDHVSIVLDSYERKKIQAKLIDISADLKDDSKPTDIILEKITELVTGRSRSVSMANVYDAARMWDEYLKHVENIKANTLKTGIDSIDHQIRGVAPGEVLTIMARSGVYKTAFLQSILKNYCQNKPEGAVFFSLEMPVASVTERYLQSIQELTGREIESAAAQPENNKELLENWRFNLKTALYNFYTVPVKVSLEKMPSYIQMIEQKKKCKIGVIGIDYLGLVESRYEKEYDHVSHVARGTKDLAKKLNIPAVILCQLNRQAEDGTVEVHLNQGRGSGAIEESADFVLGMWINEQLICKILKNRKGEKGKAYVLDIDPRTFCFSSNSYEYTPPVKKEKKGSYE
jgi:replicative DNA helicase